VVLLDALGERFDGESLAELHERVDERLALLVSGSTRDERAVDLQGVHGNLCRWASEEYPVPKSSIAICTPSCLIAVRRLAVLSTLRMSIVSVSSTVSAPGSRPLSASALSTSPMS